MKEFYNLIVSFTGRSFQVLQYQHFILLLHSLMINNNYRLVQWNKAPSTVLISGDHIKCCKMCLNIQ